MHFADRVLQADAAGAKPRRRRLLSVRLRYAIAGVLVLATALICAGAAPRLTAAPFLPALIAVTVIARLAGVAAALAGMLLLGAATLLFVIPPSGRFASDETVWTAAVLYLVCGSVVCGLMAHFRHALGSADIRNRDLERIAHTLRSRARESGELAEQLSAACRKAEAARTAADDRIARICQFHALAGALCRPSLTRAEIASIAMDRAPALLACDTGAVLVADRGGEHVRIVASRGLSDGIARSIESVPLAEASPHTDALREGGAIWVSDAAELVAGYPGAASEGWRSVRAEALAALPLRTGERVAGVLVLGYRDRQRFDDADRALIELFAEQLSHAWQHAQGTAGGPVARVGRRAGRRRDDAPAAEAGTPAGADAR